MKTGWKRLLLLTICAVLLLTPVMAAADEEGSAPVVFHQYRNNPQYARYFPVQYDKYAVYELNGVRVYPSKNEASGNIMISTSTLWAVSLSNLLGGIDYSQLLSGSQTGDDDAFLRFTGDFNYRFVDGGRLYIHGTDITTLAASGGVQAIAEFLASLFFGGGGGIKVSSAPGVMTSKEDESIEKVASAIQEALEAGGFKDINKLFEGAYTITKDGEKVGVLDTGGQMLLDKESYTVKKANKKEYQQHLDDSLIQHNTSGQQQEEEEREEEEQEEK